MHSFATQAVAASPRPIRVLLIEDHVVMRTGLRLLIDSWPGLTVVGEAADGVSALALAAQAGPDVVLLDLDLGALSGLALLPDLLVAAPEARVLVLTGVHDAADHRRAIRCGAMGIVLKDQPSDVLLKAIEKVAAGEVWIDRFMLATIVQEQATEPVLPTAQAGQVASLTEREHVVIALVAEGLKNKQIADRLAISEATVRHHLSSIFAKLGVENRLEMVILAHRAGLAKL